MKRSIIHETVPAEQPRTVPCKIAFVGEAPVDEDTLAGRPLSSSGGRLFDRALRLSGIDRADCLVTNVFNAQLPDNDVGNWCLTTAQLAAWKKEDKARTYTLPSVQRGKFLHPDHAHHLTRLREELEAVRPNLVVTLGATAMWAVLGLGNIKARRGAIHTDVRGRKVLPTIHPAAILRGADELYHLFLMDMQKAAREGEFPDVRVPNRRFILEPTVDDVRTYCEVAKREADILSVDIETKPAWRIISSVQMAYRPDFAITIPFLDSRRLDGNYWRSVDEEIQVRRLLADILSSPIPKVGQNFSYDWVWLHNDGLTVRNYLHDTRLEHYVLWPEIPKDLGTLGSVYSNEGAWKTERPGRTTKREE